MGILNIPWNSRPGYRLEKEGVDKLSNPDLLSILLGKGKNESVIQLSNRLLSKYNLNKLEELGFKELTKECKNDKVPALKVLSFIELSKRYNKLVKGGYNYKEIRSAKDVYNMFVDTVRSFKKEVLYVVLLNSKNKPVNVKRISEGTLNSSLIHPREVFKDAIKESSNSIILVHNHPSGDCSPSDEDSNITNRLINLGDGLGIKVLDHVIIGKSKFYSFTEEKG